MTYPQLYACATVLMLAVVASFGLLAYVMDIITIPGPDQIVIEYNRPVHVHRALPAQYAGAIR